MSNLDPSAIPLATFKNIVVTAVKVGTELKFNCMDPIPCSTPDTILNFQLVQEVTDDPDADYVFDTPGVIDESNQFGTPTISKSGKMLTVCNEVSKSSFIKLLLQGHDRHHTAITGKHDPQIVNRPDGATGQ
jgi:hypothetical protein